MRHRVVYTYNISVPPGLFTWLGAKLIGAKAVAMIYDMRSRARPSPGASALPRPVAPPPPLAAIRWPGADRRCHRGRLCAGPTPSHGRRDPAAGPCPGRPQSSPPDGKAICLHRFRGQPGRAQWVSVLLEAFARLPGEGYRLRIAGRGPLQAQVQAAAADRRIEYLGFLSFEEVLRCTAPPTC